MSECTVLIAAADLLPVLGDRAQVAGAELLAFADTEALRALDAIITRRPAVIALERRFAATSRGTALVNRIKADPSLVGSEVRIVGGDTPSSSPVTSQPEADFPPIGAAAVAPAAPLDAHGTRRAPRYAITNAAGLLIDGNPSTLVNLSVSGAQVLSSTVLRPNQRVRVAIANEAGMLRANGTIAWASFEIPPGVTPRYRAGIAFVSADTDALQAFCLKHGSPVNL